MMPAEPRSQSAGLGGGGIAPPKKTRSVGTAVYLAGLAMRDTLATPQSSRAAKTYVFYCSNHPAAGRLASHNTGQEAPPLLTIGLPCAGKIDVPYLLKAFETGAQAVVVLTCPTKDCRHLEGTLRTQKRAQAVDALLEEIGVGPGRITVLEWKENGLEQALGDIRSFIDKVRKQPAWPAQPASATA